MNRIIFYFIIMIGIQSFSQQEVLPTEVLNQVDVKAGMNEVLGQRDPFKRPKYLEELEQEEVVKTKPPAPLTEDEKVEAIRRWSVEDYKVVAIMWNVDKPKVMVTDPKGNLHTLQKNFKIGRNNGIISSINEGEMIVTEKGTPMVLKIIKPDPEKRAKKK